MDVGLISYFLTKTGCDASIKAGIVNANFVYLALRRRVIHPSEIAFETPVFATLGKGEIDFFAFYMPKAIRMEEKQKRLLLFRYTVSPNISFRQVLCEYLILKQPP